MIRHQAPAGSIQ